MVKHIKHICIALLSTGTLPAYCQGQEVMSVSQDSVPENPYVVVYADVRLEMLTRKSKSDMSIPSRMRGYRVQIFSGNDKNKAIQTKIDFAHRFPDIPTYMTYTQPQFRVKAGNFRTRKEAMELYKQIQNIYPTIMIVPDIIVTNSIKND